ncbi:MAG: MOSC domain-containing protein [Gammaproteobacteria bacterium]|nr:MOSC domain-containing protein [Gammaproteobacteria bacterium]
MLTTQASLDDLNSRMDENIPMARFRPNLVVAGCEAFAEDEWKQ